MALTTLKGTGQSGEKAVTIDWPATTSDPTVTITGGDKESADVLVMRLTDDTRYVDVSWAAGSEMEHRFGSI